MNRLIRRSFTADLGAIILLLIVMVVMLLLKQHEPAYMAAYAALIISWLNYEQLVMVWRKVRAARRRKGLPS